MEKNNEQKLWTNFQEKKEIWRNTYTTNGSKQRETKDEKNWSKTSNRNTQNMEHGEWRERELRNHQPTEF